MGSWYVLLGAGVQKQESVEGGTDITVGKDMSRTVFINTRIRNWSSQLVLCAPSARHVSRADQKVEEKAHFAYFIINMLRSSTE